jgi:hypothetical protein
MLRNTRFSSLAHLVAIFSLGLTLGCGVGADEESESSIAQNLQDQAACGITDVEPVDEVRACEPGNTKKTTICHVPPGNPANAHTLCIGNAAVKHHLKNHDGDSLGPCKREVMCPPPPSGTGGVGGSMMEGTGGAGGSMMGTGGAGGEGGTAGTGAVAGSAGQIVE